ncbi:lipoyl protein ligase domain-containing protein [Prochlorococcus sp. MIT 1223]|uniref:lipoyl protein ligase domain-containing protein n=1 Tax=Prochlorococcus sp. MIT 1223 TaxID=3096217 RepID=UPI002A747F35|nr:lipoate--protein ligase family protein [Prochlorococcus sp. MIT 1223]
MKIKQGAIFNHIKLAGNQQMEIDKYLLEKSLPNSNYSMSARFYSWKGTWLSIGKNQKDLPKRWNEVVKQEKINIIRRPTGGDAVLHSGGITYALTWKEPPRKKKKAYFEASQWLINGFAELGIPLFFGSQMSTSSTSNCFSTSTLADLIDHKGNKRIGSAQFWQKGSLLQHGEILLDPPREIWKNLFKNDPPPPIELNLSAKEIEDHLLKALIFSWPETKWVKKNLYDEINIKKIING